ncbi:MAG: hypothetical protein CVT73_01115 [Alphaproteobacteria bacterium HGW-Alphaproteobacteria-12]|nr:MAG: hypothetical protein CVT73_01115 [Alphaproteobacteria bacterium HGW-Alphaproteobacteria-12]
MATSKKSLNKQIIRRSFDISVERAARLASFSIAPPFEFNSEIADRAEKLAHDDLIVFAISARRLFDATGLTALSRSSRVIELRPQMNQWHLALEHRKEIPLRDILNMVVHSDLLEIATHELHVLTLAGLHVPSDVSIRQIAEGDFRRTPPILLLRSDKMAFRFIRLSQMIDCFGNCLDEIVGRCSDMGIELEVSSDNEWPVV